MLVRRRPTHPSRGILLFLAASVLAPGAALAQAETAPIASPELPAAEAPPPAEPVPAPASGEELPPEDEPPEQELPRSPTGPVPRYVVWRIKAGSGAGALAPRLERRLRQELERRLGQEVLTKAAQTGILLIRPELADCDGNLPCALDVAEALQIRFVVGGEAVMSQPPRLTGWVIDHQAGGEVRRTTVNLEAPTAAGEDKAVAALADALLAPVAKTAAAATAAEEAGPAAGRRGLPAPPRALGVAALGVSAAQVAVAGVLGLGACAALGTSGYGAWVRQNFHTARSVQLSVGALAMGGGLAALAGWLVLTALPWGLAGLATLVLR